MSDENTNKASDTPSVDEAPKDATSPAEKDNIRTVEKAPTPEEATKAAEDAQNDKTDVEVPARAQTAPSDGAKSGKKEDLSNDVHVVQHLDRDPNDPRNAEPARNLPSLDEESQQGPAHGRVSNDADHTETGKNFPS